MSCATGLDGDDANGSDYGGPDSGGAGCITGFGGSLSGSAAVGAREAGWGEEVEAIGADADPQRHRFRCQGRSQSCTNKYHASEAEEEKGQFSLSLSLCLFHSLFVILLRNCERNRNGI